MMRDVSCSLDMMQSVKLQPAQVGQVSDFSAVADYLPAHARALEHNGRIIGCFGLFQVRDGVAEAWTALSSEVTDEHPIELTKTTRSWLLRWETDWGLRRITASVAVGHEAGHRWTQWHGFEYEGTMQNYGIDGHVDFALYARTG